MTKHLTKKWKNFLLNRQNSLFQSFPTLQWHDLSYDFILKIHTVIFNGKQNLVLVFCVQNTISSTLFRDQTLEIYSGRIRGKP